MTSQEVEQMSETASKFIMLKNYQETMDQLKKIENAIMASCMNSSATSDLKINFYSNLMNIVSEVANNSKSYHFYEEDLTLLKSCFTCLRNSFYNNDKNQYLIAKDKTCTTTMASILNSLMIMDSHLLVNSNRGAVFNDQFKQVFDNTLSACISFFINLVTGNRDVRKIIWPLLQQKILDMVHFSGPEVNHIGAALLHQFLIEDDLKEDIIRRGYDEKLLQNLLDTYIHEGQHACFALYCIDILIKSVYVIPSTWYSLKPVEAVLLLEILISNTENDCVPDSVLLFFIEFFKKQSDHFLKLQNNSVNLNPQVLIQTAMLICSAAASDHYRSILQTDKSLLISTFYVVKSMTNLGASLKFEPRYSGLSEAAVMEEIKSHPMYGFKCNLIRLLASLVYQHKVNQDTVRELNGILMFLENSQYDAFNPFIREACIFALRNLLEGNEENQRVVSSLQLRGPAENEAIKKLGLNVSVNNGKLSLHH
ncbi:Ataxin-10 [Armadillidium vulgare]|nr:Ataxin-10 [Armadillidium vulgare]